ncbi:heparinase II/III family protein [Pseudorhodobacter sp. MZDSW-24AT]|uniref:heparinase II/III family protein n=1 Tax=Pseudorhodobacter sp. MZDSW-24AT TaxID=2052957 RepID=UPI000C1F9227|nr:heparinase II/III family protein [Pseudorhodobacter sp. MZDSW-24AT]PJF08617.1 heparinase [Pseudorhodobacter sp. MZDSW-24AT]
MATQRATQGSFRASGLRVRLAVWQAARGPVAEGFTSSPEPRSIGLFARGRQLVAGNFLFAGHLVEAPGTSLWDIAPPDADFATEMQGFGWLDDLAALGDAQARQRAQSWTQDWIARYGAGKGPGWTPDLTGRRVIRWIHHALFLLNGADSPATQAYYRVLTTQTRYLARHWARSAPGLPRFEALTGLVYAGLSLIGMGALVAPAVAALSAEARAEIDAGGGIATRNPEELLEVFTLLNWAAQALSESGHPVPADQLDAIERIAPTLRALRHADGGLARFHGGGKGAEGRLDQALATAGIRPHKALGHGNAPAMGFVRLSAGRTSILLDAAAPPGGRAGGSAHASTLAMEVTSGRRPLVVNCGSGGPFGTEWRMAGRATPSHSTLCIDGVSSSRFGPASGVVLQERAAVLTLRQQATADGAALHAAHDGWAQTHGLTHARDLALSSDGRHIAGTDTLISLNPQGRARFERVLAATGLQGVPFSIRFHLHPDTDSTLDMGGNAVSVALKSGEIWVFRHSSTAKLALEPSVYLERGRLKPRATKQIVLSGHAAEIETRIGWTLAKAQDTPLAIRDLDRDDPPVPL